MVNGVRVQNHQLQGFGELKYSLDLALNLRYKDRTPQIYQVRFQDLKDCQHGHLDWSGCWISPLWVFCWGQISWLKTGRQLREWLRFCRENEDGKIHVESFQVDLLDFSHLQWPFAHLSILLTFPQICVSGSQKELSASYLSPRKQRGGNVKGGLDVVLLNVHW